MKGYIVKSGSEYLTKALFWYHHEKPELAYVFNRSEIELIRQASPKWDIKPTVFIPATYKNGAVEITGSPKYPF